MSKDFGMRVDPADYNPFGLNPPSEEEDSIPFNNRGPSKHSRDGGRDLVGNKRMRPDRNDIHDKSTRSDNLSD